MISAEPGRARAIRGQLRSTLLAYGSAVGLALAGAVLWALVALVTGIQLSVIGLLIGLAVGAAVARLRPGHIPTVAVSAGVAFAGCALGPFLTIIFVSLNQQVPLSTILGHLGVVFHAYPSAVGWEGLLFWATAVLAALWLPLRRRN